MSFFSSIQQVVSEVTSGVSNLGLSPRRFSFSRDSSQGSQKSFGGGAQEGTGQSRGGAAGSKSQGGSLHSRTGRGRLGPKCVPSPGIGAGNLQPRGALGRGRRLSMAPTATGQQIHQEPQQQAQQNIPPHREIERNPLPVLHCGDRYTFWPEYDPSQTWVGESDGHWLEQFTSLGWHHNEALKALHASASRQGSKEVSFDTLGKKSQEEGMEESKLESLYVEVLYTIYNQIGAQVGGENGRTTTEDLLRYADAAFHLEHASKTRLQAVVHDEKPPVVVLNLIVVEAEGLEAKDPNGFSDPYCMMGIIIPESKPPPSPSPCPLSPAVQHSGGVAAGTVPHHHSLSATASFIAAASAFAGSRSPSQQSNHSDSFSDPYCMLGIQPLSTSLAPSYSPKELTHGSPPPESPRIRGQTSRGSQDTDNESEGDRTSSCDGSRPYSKENKDNLRKHHSFRLSFKRRTGDSKSRDHRDSITNVIPAKIIRATSVRSHTLNPRWNEKFRLDIEDINTDILHLDIWDHDDETSVLEMVSKLNEVKGVKGLGRFFKQVAQSARSGGQDDFLGCVNIPLQEIPSTGLDKWFPLEGRSQRSNIQGEIHLKLWLSTREDRRHENGTSWAESKQHRQIISLFIAEEMSRMVDDSLSWDGNLDPAGETILHQHALQGDLTPLHQAMCRWLAFVGVHMTSYVLDHRILQRRLVALHDLWEQNSLNRIEEEVLGQSFQQFIEKALEEVRGHRDLFPVPSKSNVFRLEGLFKCISLLAESTIYWKVSPFHKELRGETLVALRRAAHERYSSLREGHQKGAKAMDTESLVNIILQLTSDLQSGLDYYEHATNSTLKIPYVSLNYKIFEKLTNEDTEGEAWRLCALIRELELSREVPRPQMNIGSGPFLLYLALAEFSRFQEQVPVSERRILVLGAVWPHFFPSLSKWLDIVSWRLLCRIRVAILSDRVANTGEPVQYTTSAVDTTSCLYHVKTFWRHLAWPDPNSGYSLLAKLLQALSLGTDYYVGLLQQRLLTLSAESSPDERAQQLCITVNNMEHVRHSFSLIYEELQLEEFGRVLETQDPRNGKGCAEHINNLIQATLISLHDRITESMNPVAEKMRIELHRDVFHLAWSPDSLPAEDAVRPLLEHLHGSLTQFSLALLKNNLDRLLALLWQDVLNALVEQIGKDSEEKQATFFTRFYDALELLKEFFYANGRGLDPSILHGYDYYIVENQLRLHKTLTEHLIEAYHLERLSEQEKMEGQTFGSIFVRVYFNHDSLCVEVLQAKNVIPLDPNGLSDPFVVVELLPRRLFPQSSPQHTNVHKKTLNPLFDECFELEIFLFLLTRREAEQPRGYLRKEAQTEISIGKLGDTDIKHPATLESCQAEGAMVLFTLMDHDVITCNDFGGEAFLSLNAIPGVGSTTTLHSFHGLKPIELPLMFRKESENLILKVLETRTNDKLAQEFVKKQKQRLKLQ